MAASTGMGGGHRVGRISCGGVRAMPRALAALIVLAGAPAAEDAWIFAGQSNMNPRAQSKAFAEALAGRAPAPRALAVQQDGRPIAYFLPAADGAGSAGAGWSRLESAVRGLGDATLAGMVYYQGESDQGRYRAYGADLRRLVAEVRSLAGSRELPVVVVQLGPRARTGSSTKGPLGPWCMPLLREVQRRTALADPRMALVAALDQGLRDPNVHIDAAGHAAVGRRAGLAALRLRYGDAAASSGPVPLRAWRGADARSVTIAFAGVRGRLRLAAGWRSGFSLARGVDLPEDLAAWPDDAAVAAALPANPGGLAWAESAEVVGDGTQVALRFADPVDARSRVSWGGTNGADLGPHALPTPGFAGLVDEAGIVPAAGVLLPISPEPVK